MGFSSSSSNQNLSPFAKALASYQNQSSLLAGLGADNPSGQAAPGLLDAAFNILGRPGSAVVGLISGLTGTDHPETGDQNAGGLFEGLDRAGKALAQGAHYGTGDFPLLKMNDSDSFGTRLAKGAGAFTLDTLSDPLSYLDGAGVLVKGGKLAIRGVGDALTKAAPQLLEHMGAQGVNDLIDRHLMTITSNSIKNAADGAKQLADLPVPQQAALARHEALLATPEGRMQVAAEQLAREGQAATAQYGRNGLRRYYKDTIVSGANDKLANDLFQQTVPEALQGGLRITSPLGLFGEGKRVTGQRALTGDGLTVGEHLNLLANRASVLPTVQKVTSLVGGQSGVVFAAAKKAVLDAKTPEERSAAIGAYEQFEKTKLANQMLVSRIGREQNLVEENVAAAAKSIAPEDRSKFDQHLADLFQDPVRAVEVLKTSTDPVELAAAHASQQMHGLMDKRYGEGTSTIDTRADISEPPADYTPYIARPEFIEHIDKDRKGSLSDANNDVARFGKGPTFFRDDGKRMTVAEANQRARSLYKIDFDAFETDPLRAWKAYMESWNRIVVKNEVKKSLLDSGYATHLVANLTESGNLQKVAQQIARSSGKLQESAASKRERKAVEVGRHQDRVDALTQQNAALKAHIDEFPPEIDPFREGMRLHVAELHGRQTEQLSAAEAHLVSSANDLEKRLSKLDAEVEKAQAAYDKAAPKGGDVQQAAAKRVTSRKSERDQVAAALTSSRNGVKPEAIQGPGAPAVRKLIAAHTAVEKKLEAKAATKERLAANPARLLTSTEKARAAAIAQWEKQSRKLSASQFQLKQAQRELKEIDDVIQILPSFQTTPSKAIDQALSIDDPQLRQTAVEQVMNDLLGMRRQIRFLSNKKIEVSSIPPIDTPTLTQASSRLGQIGEAFAFGNINGAELPFGEYSRLKGAGVDAGSANFQIPSFAVALANQFLVHNTGHSSELADWFNQTYTPFYNLFRLSATIGRGPGFHTNNFVGALWQNWLGGVSPAETLQGFRIAKAHLLAQKDVFAARDLSKTVDEQIGDLLRQRLSSQDLHVFDQMEQATAGYLQGKHLLNDITGNDPAELSVLDLMIKQTERGSFQAPAQSAYMTPPKNWTPSLTTEDLATPWGDLKTRTSRKEMRANGVSPLGVAGGKAANAYGNWFINRSSARMGEFVESTVRLAAFSAGLRQYGSATAADMMVKALHFDYADLTDFERRYLRAIVPFYTWSRKNVPLQLRALASQPNKFLALERAHENIQNVMPTNAEQQQKFNEATPQWLRDKLGYLTPLNDSSVALTMNLPATDLNTWLQAGKMPVRWQQAVSMMSPVVKVPIETATGVNTQSGAAFNPYGTPAAGWMKALGLTYKNSAGEDVVSEPVSRAINNFLPPVNNVQKLIGAVPGVGPVVASKNDTERSFSNLLSFAGVSSGTLTDRQLKGELLARSKVQTPELDALLGALGVDKQKVSDLKSKGYPTSVIVSMIKSGYGQLDPQP